MFGRHFGAARGSRVCDAGWGRLGGRCRGWATLDKEHGRVVVQRVADMAENVGVQPIERDLEVGFGQQPAAFEQREEDPVRVARLRNRT